MIIPLSVIHESEVAKYIPASVVILENPSLRSMDLMEDIVIVRHSIGAMEVDVDRMYFLLKSIADIRLVKNWEPSKSCPGSMTNKSILK